MQKTKVAITLDAKLLGQLDALVDEGRFPNRSQAIESAISDKLDRIVHRRLALECSKLDRENEIVGD
jgi:metal-responsive CopG/Arc/MetJ family transcriptional regulator